MSYSSNIGEHVREIRVSGAGMVADVRLPGITAATEPHLSGVPKPSRLLFVGGDLSVVVAICLSRDYSPCAIPRRMSYSSNIGEEYDTPVVIVRRVGFHGVRSRRAAMRDISALHGCPRARGASRRYATGCGVAFTGYGRRCASPGWSIGGPRMSDGA